MRDKVSTSVEKPRLSEADRINLGTMSINDLKRLARELKVLRSHFDRGRECWRTVDDCIEVTESLADRWTADNGGNRWGFKR